MNIKEAHVFNTDDKFSLDVFVADGWESEVWIVKIVCFCHALCHDAYLVFSCAPLQIVASMTFLLETQLLK